MAQPDALSRQSRFVPDGSDNEGRTLLTPERLEIAAIRPGHVEIEGDADLL